MYHASYVKFENPDVSTNFWETHNGNIREEETLNNMIKQHHFNSKIILYLPDTSSLSQSFLNVVVEDASFYYVKALSVHEFCDIEFKRAFTDCGNVFCYTPRTRLDVDDCAAFIPSGSLFILLDNFKYHELGISGKLSSHILRTPKNRYFIEIDTNENGFSPEKKLYKKIMQALTDCPLKFDFYVTWIPNDEDVCPSSIAKYFQDKGYNVEEVYPDIKESLRNNLVMPRLSEINDDLDLVSILEWLGMHAADVDEKFIQTSVPEPFCTVDSMTVAFTDGFYPPVRINEILKYMRAWLNERDEETVPWVCMTVYGPPDALISWSKNEHSFKSCGENFYVLIVLRDRVLYFSVEEGRKPQRFLVKSSNKK